MDELKEVRLMENAVKVMSDLVEEFGALNPRPVIDTLLRVLTVAILTSGNPDAEMAHALRELPNLIEQRRPDFEARHTSEPRN